MSCGTVYADTDVQIVDPMTLQTLAHGKIGEIWVRSPAVAEGYWRRSAESADVFLAQPTGHNAGPYLRTGDLGFLFENELFISGRLKDLIIIRGSNHYPQDLEWTAQRSDAAFHGQTSAAFSVVVEGSERLILLQEVDRLVDLPDSSQQRLANIVEAIVEQHEIDVFHVLLLKRGSIPKTASGKVQRQASRKAYLANELEFISQWRADRMIESFDPGMDRESSRFGGNSVGTSVRTVRTGDELIDWLRKYASRRLNSRLMDERRTIAPHAMLDFGNQGLFGLQVPKQYGGLELAHVQMLSVLEQLAAIDLSLATLVFLSNTNGLRPILHFAAVDLQTRLLPGLATGRQLAAFALSEPEAGANIGAIEATAVRLKSGGWKLSGVKRWNGSAWASWVTVMAREADAQGRRQGISAFLVPLDADGVRVGEESLTTGLRSIVQNSLQFTDVVIPPVQLLGESGRGMDVANDARGVGRLCVAAVSLGAMRRTLQLFHRYATRRQISTGRLLDHPLVIARLSEMTDQIQTVSVVVRQLAEELDRGIRLPAWMMMVVKVAASEYLNFTTASVVQLLGGRGYMENNEVSRIWRDAKSLSIGEGPNESLLGYLGQSQTFNEFLGWLSEHAPSDIAALVKSAGNQIRTASQKLASLSGPQREQWASYLSGQLVVGAFLHAAVLRSLNSADLRISAWTRRLLEQTIAAGNEFSQSGPSSQGPNELDQSILGFANSIGDIHQGLPGEDVEIDPLLGLATAGEPTGSARPSENPPSETIEDSDEAADQGRRRRLLEAALRERLASKK